MANAESHDEGTRLPQSGPKGRRRTRQPEIQAPGRRHLGMTMLLQFVVSFGLSTAP